MKDEFLLTGKKWKYKAEIWKLDSGKYNYKILLNHEIKKEEYQEYYKTKKCLIKNLLMLRLRSLEK